MDAPVCSRSSCRTATNVESRSARSRRSSPRNWRESSPRRVLRTRSTAAARRQAPPATPLAAVSAASQSWDYNRSDMIRPTVARVDLGALKSNYRHIVDHLAREGGDRAPGVIAVVKANAYGHGAAQVARGLEDA